MILKQKHLKICHLICFSSFFSNGYNNIKIISIGKLLTSMSELVISRPVYGFYYNVFKSSVSYRNYIYLKLHRHVFFFHKLIYARTCALENLR